jgi:5-methylcytosine-specific restriction endonuclease McrA
MTSSDAARFDGRDGAAEHDWMRAHSALTRLARERAAADAEEGRWLLVAWRSRAHGHLGYGSFSEYIERLLGYTPRTTREKLRVAEALESLPLAARALAQGTSSWCALRELTRVATTETESAWLDAANGKTTRDLERLVAGKRPGDYPPRPGEMPGPSRHVLRFDVAPETFAIFREAMCTLRRAAGANVDDDALLLEMARRALGAPTDDGRSGHRITYELCPACGRGAQLSGGQPIPVGTDVLTMAACDGEHIGAHVPKPANQNHTPVAIEPESAPVPQAPLRTHVGRARQAVPPALRRAVLLRDRHRCSVPGCTNTHYVDVHHIRPRSEGGPNTLENLITLCSAHHRATHRGDLIIDGRAGELCIRHADGTPYGQPVTATSADTHAKIYSALHNLGFRDREIHAVLAEIRTDTALRNAPIEHMLRAALRRIRPNARKRPAQRADRARDGSSG